MLNITILHKLNNSNCELDQLIQCIFINYLEKRHKNTSQIIPLLEGPKIYQALAIHLLYALVKKLVLQPT